MLVAFLLSGCTRSAAGSTEQQRAASALFDQYEIVFYAKSDLLSGSGGYKQLSQQGTNALRVPFANLLQGPIRSANSYPPTSSTMPMLRSLVRRIFAPRQARRRILGACNRASATSSF